MRISTFVLTFALCLSTAAQTAPKQNAGKTTGTKKPASTASVSPLPWQPWSDAAFAEAKQQNRFVLLDLEAVWCHWCHVMDEITYRDPAVIRLLQAKYVLVKVDQDSRPDISNRYEDYGWPATVVFDGDGKEIVKRQGYIPPRPMASMLQAIIDDPSPGPSVQPEEKIEFPADSILPDALRNQLRREYVTQYDPKHGGWGFIQKYLDPQSVEYGLGQAWAGDKAAERMARQTLTAELHLIDPAWGGVYQYSVDGDWKEPHFEKIMARQTDDLRVYAEAYALWHQPEYLKAAQAIHRYLKTFLLSPEGAFYTSQDADLVQGKHSAAYFGLPDQARRKLGIPRIDMHRYARENGWAVAAIAAFYSVTGEQDLLDEANRAAAWIEQNRSLPEGGFRHDEQDAAGPYLGDTLAMARAYLALYSVTGDRGYLRKCEAAMSYIAANFSAANGAGFSTAKADGKAGYEPRQERDENAMLARVANLTGRYSGNSKYEAMAAQALRYLIAPPVAKEFPTAAVLLADIQRNTAPLHVTIVGAKDDATAQALFHAAMGLHPEYKRIEWWDAREGKLPNPDVQYPELPKAAAFLCSERACSPPVYQPEGLQMKADRWLHGMSGTGTHEP